MALEVPDDFGFTEEHELLRGEARRFLAERCPIAEVRKISESDSGHDPALWKELGELGWLGLLLPESVGGAGLGTLHLSLLLEEMGRTLLPTPYLSSLLAGLAVRAAGSDTQQERFLPGIASGDTVAALGSAEPDGSWEAGDVSARAEEAGGGYRLSGRKCHVLGGPFAALLVAPFREADGTLALFAVDLASDGVRIDPETSVDATRRTARIELDGVSVPKEARLEGDGEAALAQVLRIGTAGLAAEMVGAFESTLELTRTYAIERKQFDRPIGFFQAVKHPIVDMMIDLELGRSLAYAAAAALDASSEDADIPVRMAKAQLSESFPAAVRKCVQLHGGYGFTWDCDAHLYFKRAMWSRATFGDGLHHRRHLASQLF